MIDFKEWEVKYREYLAIRNYAVRTIESRLFYLKRFFKYLREIEVTEIMGVKKDTIQNYQIYLYEEINYKGEPNSVSAQNNALQVVKTFFHFLWEYEYLVSDPARDVDYAKEPQRLPRSILTGAEMKKLLRAPNIRSVVGYRDRVILEVLYSTGIRKEEINNLLLTDVDYRDGLVRVNAGKGRKDRIVPIGKIACRYLENYIKGVRSSLVRDPHNDHLFLSLRGNGLSKNMVWKIVKQYAKKAKLKKNITPHTFRHTCATLMLRNKANVRHIQELLGHSSLDSTQVYTQVSITDLKEAHSKCHPRERDGDQ